MIGEILVQEYKLPATRWLGFGNLMCSMLVVVNNTVLYTWK